MILCYFVFGYFSASRLTVHTSGGLLINIIATCSESKHILHLQISKQSGRSFSLYIRLYMVEMSAYASQ